MRNIFLLVLVLVLIIGTVLFLNREKFSGFGVKFGTNSIASSGADETVSPTASGVSNAAATPSSIINPPPSSAPATNGAPVEPLPVIAPGTVLDNCRVIIHNYNAAFGENPVGDNAEITAALTGNNPKGVNFLRENSGLKRNEKGELLDGYGTPFFFHQVSAKVMEIRSAGLDRKLWTFDDEVTR